MLPERWQQIEEMYLALDSGKSELAGLADSCPTPRLSLVRKVRGLAQSLRGLSEPERLNPQM